MKNTAIAVLTAVALSFAAPSVAGTITLDLHNTGAGLTVNGQVDANYTVWTNAFEGTALAHVSGHPLGDTGDVWASPPDPNVSQWITPFAGTVGAPGVYNYETRFFLPDNFTSASITGWWATDDFGEAIRLNGQNTGHTITDDNAYVTLPGFDFTITSGFQQGWNTLTFVVRNEDDGGSNPTGLHVVMSGTATVPDAGATFMLLSVALAGLGALRRHLLP